MTKSIRIVWVGLILIAAAPGGYAQETESSNDDHRVFITLTRKPLESKDLPTNTSVLTSEEIQKLNIQNVGDAVQIMAGVTETKSGGLGLTRLPAMRGFFNKQIRVVIDDQPLPPDLTGNIDLSQFPVENVDRIEIVRGANSVAYGANAEGGVIHIITKRAHAYEPGIDLSSQYGSYNTQTHRLGLSGKAGRTEGFFSVSRNLSGGFQQNSDFHNLSFSGQSAYDFGGAGKTSFQFFLANSEVGVPSGTPVSIDQFDGTKEKQANDPTARQKDHTQTLRLEHSVPIAKEIALKLRLEADDTRRFFTSPQTAFTDENKVASRTGTILAELPLGFSGGFEYQRQYLNSISFGAHDTANWSTFLQEQMELGERLTAIVGYRHDQSVPFGASDNPRFTFVYRAFPFLKFSSNVGRAFQAPTFADLFSPFAPPDPNLKPETSWHYDVGAEATPSDNLSIKTTMFRADTDDRIALDPARSFAAFNLTKAHSTGVEVEINHKAGRISQNLNYTYLNNEGQKVGSSDFQLLQFSPHHVGNYRVAVDLPAGFGLTSNVRYLHEQFTDINKGGVRIPQHAIWNVRLSKIVQILRQGPQKMPLEAFFGVDNLLNKRYAENADAFNGYFPQPGRTYWGGLSLKFWS